MSGICPNCKEKLEHVLEIQETTVRYDAKLTKKGEMKYGKDKEYGGDCVDWGHAECPECGEVIEDIYDEDDAIAFLKGEWGAPKVEPEKPKAKKKKR